MFDKLKITLEMVKIEHTVFALPFAFLGAFLAAEGLPRADQAGWILVAMIGARSAAMAMNRLVDLPFDARNPRTANRALPAKLVSVSYVAAFTAVSSSLLILAAAMLNPLALKLSPLALGIVFFYSYTKRFTWLTHVVLGVALSCAPVGAWIAVRGSLEWTPILLGMSVVLWVAGFDILYACQDVDFDRNEPLHSIPKRFGIRAALWISAALHAAMAGLLAYLFWSEGLGALSFTGLAIAALLMGYEHTLVRPSDLSRINAAFFTLNGWISVLLFVTAGLDIIWHKS